MRNNDNNGVLINKKLNVWIIKSYFRSSGKISSGLPWITNSRVPNFLKFHDWWLFSSFEKKNYDRSGLKIHDSVRTWNYLLVVEAHSNPNITRFDLIWFLEVVKSQQISWIIYFSILTRVFINIKFYSWVMNQDRSGTE